MMSSLHSFQARTYAFRSKEFAAQAMVVATDAASQQSAPVTVRFRIAGR